MVLPSRFALLLLVLLGGVPVMPSHAAALAPTQSADDLLDIYNRWVFAWNHWFYSTLDRIGASLTGEAPPGEGLPLAPAIVALGGAPGRAEAAPPPLAPTEPAPAAAPEAAPEAAPAAAPEAAPEAAPAAAPEATPRSGCGQVLSNLINEPLTMLSSALVGDFSTAWNATQRFAINSTVGLLGWRDKASGMGYPPIAADVGLSLCRMGVGEGGYVVLPFVGPRTYRDAVADVVLVNALLWTTAGVLFSSGVSLQTVLIAELIEVVADVVATRQIDPRAKEARFDNFEQMRADYLAQRRERCD